MSIKRTMLLIWSVATIFWTMFAWHTFHVDEVIQANRLLDIYEGRYMDGDRDKQAREAVLRANKRVQRANKNLIFFLSVGAGIPGLMLVLGTVLLNRQEERQKRRK